MDKFKETAKMWVVIPAVTAGAVAGDFILDAIAQRGWMLTDIQEITIWVVAVVAVTMGAVFFTPNQEKEETKG